MKHSIKIVQTAFSIGFLLLFLLPTLGTGQVIKSMEPLTDQDDMSRTSFAFNYHMLTGKEMKDSYNNGVFGVHLERISWVWDRIGVIYGAGIIGGEGNGKVIGSGWDIQTNDLGFWALDLEGSIIARLEGDQPFNSITPFIGVGFDLYGATEKFSVTMQKDSIALENGLDKHYYRKVIGDASALRATIAGHALAGVIIPVGLGNDLEVDFKALFSANGGYHDLVSADEESTLERDVYSVIKRPSFNFTGYSLRVALTF